MAVEPVMKVKPVQVQPTTMQHVQFGSVQVEPGEVDPVQVEPLQLEPLQIEIHSPTSTSNAAIFEGVLQLKTALKFTYDTRNSFNFILKGKAACLILKMI